LRRQLGQAGSDPRYKAMLETFPKRGYRVGGEVAALERATAPRRHRRGWSWLVAAAGICGAILLLWLGGWNVHGARSNPGSKLNTTAAASIAVLPFVDMSPGRDQGYFAEGIAEEILNRL